jgi:cytochrome c556
MTYRKPLVFALVLAALGISSAALSDHDPRHTRQQLMKSVGKAAKPLGGMLKGEREFDAATVMESLEKWHSAQAAFGDLFPEGSETGMETEAAPAIWEDRAGFDAALADFRDATDAAIAANPQTLEDAKPVLGAVFKTCKGCHDTYRIDKD